MEREKMKIKIEKNRKTFELFLDFLHKLGTEIKMVFSPEQLSMTTSHSGQIVLNTTFKKDFFEEYDIAGEKEEINLYLNDIKQAVKKSEGAITVEEKEGALEITDGKNLFKMPTLVELDNPQELPPIEYDYSIDFTFSDMLKALEKVKLSGSEVVEIFTDDGMLKFKSREGIREIVAAVKEAPQLSGKIYMGISLLENVADKSTDKYTMFLKEDFPLKIEYNKDGAVMIFMVAPRVTPD